MKFSDENYGQQMMNAIKKFCEDTGLQSEFVVDSFATINHNIVTHADRARELAAFSRLVLSEVGIKATEYENNLRTTKITFSYYS